MDRSEVERIAEGALEPMAMALHVREWEVSLLFHALESGRCAENTPNPPYLRAEIVIDPAQMEDEAQVLNDLRHELLHLVHGEFEVYRATTQTIMLEGDAEIEGKMYVLAAERTVAKLERMLDGLGFTPERLANWTGH